MAALLLCTTAAASGAAALAAGPLAGACALLVGALVVRAASSTHVRMRRIAVRPSEEVLVVEAVEAGRAGATSFFLVDTGYAGPPVLSLAYLTSAGRPPPLLPPLASAEERYACAVRAAARSSTEAAAVRAAVRRRVGEGSCVTYTSGCTMRLMGIGAVAEQQADMLLCPPLAFATTAGGARSPKEGALGAPSADVLVTNPLRGSTHILTVDYLFSVAPCRLRMREQRLETRAPLSASERRRLLPLELVGGAVVLPVVVDGTTYRCTMDTGAPGPVCLGKRAAASFARKGAGVGTVSQVGVHGEVVRSEAVAARVEVGGVVLEGASVFLNDAPVSGTDGYVGMGVLRATDILLAGDGVLLSPSGLPPRRAEEYVRRGGGGKGYLP